MGLGRLTSSITPRAGTRALAIATASLPGHPGGFVASKGLQRPYWLAYTVPMATQTNHETDPLPIRNEWRMSDEVRERIGLAAISVEPGGDLIAALGVFGLTAADLTGEVTSNARKLTDIDPMKLMSGDFIRSTVGEVFKIHGAPFRRDHLVMIPIDANGSLYSAQAGSTVEWVR